MRYRVGGINALGNANDAIGTSLGDERHQPTRCCEAGPPMSGAYPSKKSFAMSALRPRTPILPQARSMCSMIV
jgi:hypothetical protein